MSLLYNYWNEQLLQNEKNSDSDLVSDETNGYNNSRDNDDDDDDDDDDEVSSNGHHVPFQYGYKRELDDENDDDENDYANVAVKAFDDEDDDDDDDDEEDLAVRNDLLNSDGDTDVSDDDITEKVSTGRTKKEVFTFMSEDDSGEADEVDYGTNELNRIGISLAKRTARKSVLHKPYDTDFDGKKRLTLKDNSRKVDVSRSRRNDDADAHHNFSHDIHSHIYWAIQTKIDDKTGTILPVRGEFDRIARIYNVDSTVVSNVWNRGQQSIMTQVLAIAAGNTDFAPPHGFSWNNYTIKLSEEEGKTSDDNNDANVEVGVVGLLTYADIALAANAADIKPDLSRANLRRMGSKAVYDVAEVVKMIDSLPKQRKRRTLAQVAASINITKSQLYRFIKAYPDIPSFKNIIGQYSQRISKEEFVDSDEIDSSDYDESIGYDCSLPKSIRKRKAALVKKEEDEAGDDSYPMKRTKADGVKTVKSKVKGGKQNDSIPEDGGNVAKLKRQRHQDISVAAKEAIWVVLQSKYDPQKKKIPHGMKDKVAKQFNVSATLVSNIWSHGQESIKNQLEELQAAVANGDPDAIAKIKAAGGRRAAVRPDFTNRRSNCGKKSKYDVSKINDMLEAIPVSERKSIRQTAKVLGISNSHLHRILQKHNPTPKPNVRDLELKAQLKQQKRSVGKNNTAATHQDRIRLANKEDGENKDEVKLGKISNDDLYNNINALVMPQKQEVIHTDDTGIKKKTTVTNAVEIDNEVDVQSVSNTSDNADDKPWLPETNESYWY